MELTSVLQVSQTSQSKLKNTIKKYFQSSPRIGKSILLLSSSFYLYTVLLNIITIIMTLDHKFGNLKNFIIQNIHRY